MHHFRATVQTVTGLDTQKFRQFGKGKKNVKVTEVNVLEKKPTLELSVRFRELLEPLLFPVRRLSQDLDTDEDVEFYGKKGWVTKA